MKPLSESLFDSDLVDKELDYDKLEKYLKKRPDWMQIRRFLVGLSKQRIAEKITEPLLRNWCDDMREKYIFLQCGRVSPAMYDKSDESCIEAKNWLKFGEIHKEIHWSDCMYASTFDIPWGDWRIETKGIWGIYEWIIFDNKEGDVMLIVNREGYDPIDQKLIHTLIETIHKYYKK